MDIIRPSPEVVLVLILLPLLAIEWMLEFELHLLIVIFVNELYDFIEDMDTDSLTDGWPHFEVGDGGAFSDLLPNRVSDLNGDLTSAATVDSMINRSSFDSSQSASLILCGH